MKLSGIRQFKTHHPDDSCQGAPLAEHTGPETRYPRYGKGKIIISMGLDLIHAPVLCQAVYLGNHLVHLIGHDPVVTLIDNPAANLIGEGHAW